jgi:hypothetical protein
MTVRLDIRANWDKPLDTTTTIRAVADAIEKNGLPKTQKTFWRQAYYPNAETPDSDKPYVVEACAIGMAAINQGIDWSALEMALGRVKLDEPTFIDGYGTMISLCDVIIYHNDYTSKTFAEIAELIRTLFKDRLDEEITFVSYPLTIIRDEV